MKALTIGTAFALLALAGGCTQSESACDDPEDAKFYNCESNGDGGDGDSDGGKNHWKGGSKNKWGGGNGSGGKSGGGGGGGFGGRH